MDHCKLLRTVAIGMCTLCWFASSAPLLDDLNDPLKCIDDGALTSPASNPLPRGRLPSPIDDGDDVTEQLESTCGLDMCPGRTCQSQQQSIGIKEEFLHYAERLGHHLMCEIDPSASAQYGGIPIMRRGPLNSSSTEVVEIASFLLFTEWTKAFEATMKATKTTTLSWMAQARISNFTSMSELDGLYNYFMNHYTIHTDLPAATGATNVAATSPAHVPVSGSQSKPTLPEGFWQRDNATDPFLSINQRWNDDSIFAQARLMATNPLQIQRLTAAGSSVGMSWDKLAHLLNMNTFDWEAEVNNVVGMGISQAIAKHHLYVLDFPLLAQITADPHASSAFAGHKMLAPIALFAATNNESAPFVAIAIQLGRNNTSPVYTPHSGYFWWSIAKMYVNSADGLVSQIAHHLVNAHLVSEAFAAATCRELLSEHPVHALLTPHFQGLIGINTQGFALLTSPSGAVTNIAGFGYEGMGELIELTYQNWTWDHTDFIQDLKKRGMYPDSTSDEKDCIDCQKLLYYPYRDDGLLLHRKMQTYVTEYVNFYYCTDQDVVMDQDLQRWTQFVSTSHHNKGFPAAIPSKAVLTNVLLRIIWVNSVHHAILNFPVKEFGAYVPAIAYTLRKSPTDWSGFAEEIANASPENNDIFLKILPDFFVAVNQTATASQLASLRLHGIFEDASTFKSPFARQLTARYRADMVDTSNPHSVQSIIGGRNAKRKQHGVLAYRYMQPKYMPNSIVI